MSGKNCLVECGPPQDRQEGENSKRLSKVVRKRGLLSLVIGVQGYLSDFFPRWLAAAEVISQSNLAV